VGPGVAPRDASDVPIAPVADHDDERKLLRWIAEEGGPSGTLNVAGRGGEVGVESDIGELVEALGDRGLVDVLPDGDVRLTALGRALLDSPDT
jgi:hypothetical protein